MSKYLNKKTYSADGILHDSKKEAQRWDELRLLERAGSIKHLKRQVRYQLIPAQYEYLDSKHKVLLEREACYVADFCYIDDKTGKTIVEDCKGFRKGESYRLFKLKAKLMLWVHGIKVVES